MEHVQTRALPERGAQMTRFDQMKLFMEPRSIAAVGVSRRTGPGSFNLLENILGYGYEGRLFPVNPNAAEILGVKTYPHVGALPETADLALISLPRTLVSAAVRDCVAKGIKAIVIITQGFADADDAEGKRLQREILAIAAGTGTRILGPNTFGVANARLKMSTSYIRISMEPVAVGTVSQTGGTFVGLNDIKLAGKAIDVGDACDVNVVDCLEYFEQDDQTRVIVVHTEGMPDAREFLRAVRRVTLKKPVLALKTGRTPQSARAVQSHTGALAGSDRLWDTALRQAGALRVGDIEELADAMRAFLTLPAPAGNGIGLTTYTGGFGIIASDACGKYGMDLVEFTEPTLRGLRALSPEWMGVGNPFDIWPGVSILGLPRTEVERQGLWHVLSDPRVDAALMVLGAYDPHLGEELAPMACEAARLFPAKPLVFFAYGPHFEAVRRSLESTGTALAFPSPERAARALMHLRARAVHLAGRRRRTDA